MASKLRVSLISNSNQKRKALGLVDSSENLLEALLKLAKNKLQLRVPKRFFVSKGKNTAYEVTQEELDASLLTPGVTLEIFVSKGEDFVGTTVLKTASNRVAACVKVIAQDSFIHEDAMKQMKNTVKSCPGIFLAVGMPDLHPGNQFPVGVSFLTHDDVIYPALVGNDIGCGMSLYQLPVEAHSIHPEKVKKQLVSLEGVWTGDTGTDETAWKRYCQSIPNISVDPWFTQNDEINQLIGTIGGGNHFAELLKVDQCYNPEMMAHFVPTRALLLVHSGSRLLGQKVLESFKERNHAADGVNVSTPEGEAYLQLHDYACTWAKANRSLIARRFLSCINVDLEDSFQGLDVWHNRVSRKVIPTSEYRNVWIHRKGAAPSDEGLVVIPGSRGAYSYLVLPTASGNHLDSGYSLAHGAGRKIPRGRAITKIRSKYQARCSSTPELNTMLTSTPFDSAVICDDPDLLVEEHQDAYKEIEKVVQDLAHFGLIHIVARLKPMVTYKTMRHQV